MGDYLGKPDDKKLNKIKIDATDFDASTNKLNEERKKLSTKDRVAYTSHTMFYPFTIDDCFLSSSQNLFPVEYAIKHKNDLLESGQYSGMLCDVFLESGNKLGTTKSNKQLAGFPFSGGVIDALSRYSRCLNPIGLMILFMWRAKIRISRPSLILLHWDPLYIQKACWYPRSLCL